MNSDKISCIATDTEYHQSRAAEPDHHEDSSSVSLLHETHFGDSLTDIPRTVISAFKHIPPTDLERITKRYSMVKLGNTIFDCQEGCFISFEEFEKRISQESLNKYKDWVLWFTSETVRDSTTVLLLGELYVTMNDFVPNQKNIDISSIRKYFIERFVMTRAELAPK